MSRDIKFRAWDGKTMKDDFVVWSGRVTNIDEHGYYLSEDWPLMQYTGLKDKNGVNIYEGDIVKHYSHSNKTLIRQQVIEWHYSGLYMRRIEGHVSGYSELPNNRLEVIGNIYENPELLK